MIDPEKMEKMRKYYKAKLYNLLTKGLSDTWVIETWPGWADGYVINNKVYVDRHLTADGMVTVSLVRYEKVREKDKIAKNYYLDFKTENKFDIKELGDLFNKHFLVEGNELIIRPSKNDKIPSL
jgi:hypothetical protein